MRPVAALAVVTTILPFGTAQQQPQPSRELADVAAAYAAKVAASAIFVSGRSLESVLAEELAPTRPLEALIAPLLRFDVDREQGAVTCRLGAAKATAVATKDLGCTLVRPDASMALLRERGATGPADPRPAPADIDWPRGERLPAEPPSGIDVAAVRAALDAAFAEKDQKRRVHTRAVVVVHQGRLIAERYADGVHAAMPLPGWSMAKTMTHALLGMRVHQGKLDPAAALPVPEWRAEDDARRSLRLPDLLAMTGGLQWHEDYDDPKSDALRMLFASSDHAAVYAAQPVAAAPGARFLYASGATNLLCRVLRTTFADDREYWAFPRQALFTPLGMHTAVLETDPGGTFVGSSYAFASARDWARLGMLYAQRGEFAGQRVLPAAWVDAAFTPTPASGARFGQHLWLDADTDGDGPITRRWAELPADLGYMSGHEGQYCFAIPSAELVVVRLGCTKNGGFDVRALLRSVLAAVKSDGNDDGK